MVAVRRLALVLMVVLLVASARAADPPAAPPEAAWSGLEKQARQSLRDRQFGPALQDARQAVAQGGQTLSKDDEQLVELWRLVAECAERAEDWSTAGSAHDEMLRLRMLAHGPDDWRTREARAGREELEALKKLGAEDRRAYYRGTDSFEEAVRLRREGKNAASIAQAEVALATCERLLGRESVAAGYILNCLAKSTNNLGKFAEAEPLWQRSLAIHEQQLGEQHPETAFALLGLGDALWRQKKLGPARPLLQRAVKSYEASYGPDNTSLASALDSLGQACLRLNDLDAAQQAYERSLQIREKVLGPEHALSTTMMNQLAVVASAKGKHAEAQVILERMVPLREKTLGPGHKDMAPAYANLGHCYQSQGKLAEAQPLFERELAIREKTMGPTHEASAAARRNLLNVSRQRRDWPAAARLAQRAAELKQQQFGDEHLATLQALVELTAVYKEASRYAEAQKVLQRVLASQEKLLGADHIAMAEAHHGVASLLEAQAKYDEAEKHDRRALEIREQKLGSDHPKVADSLNALGMLAVARGDLEAAGPLYSRAIDILQKAHGPGNPHTLNLLNNSALLFQAQGNYAAATFYLRQLLPLTERAKGAVHLDTGMVLNNLADCYREQGNNREALTLLERSLAIHEKLLEPEHPRVAAALNNLANVNYNLGNYAESAQLFQRALAINEKVFGPEHPDTARSLGNLSNAYVIQGEFARGEPLARRALAIDEKLLGPEHRNVAVHLTSLGVLLGVMKRYDEAKPLVERALAIREKAYGPEHPEVAATLTNLAALEFELGKLAEARQHEARGLEIQLKHLERTSLVQSEQAQFLMMHAARLQLDGWLRTTAELPDAPAEAWQRVLIWKGLTTSRQTALRQSLQGDPVFAEFTQVSEQLSNTALNPPQPPADPVGLALWEKEGPGQRAQWQDKLDALKRRHAQLEQALALRSALARQDQAVRATTVADMEACLRGFAKPTALVDLIEYDYTASNREKAGRRIAAFVVRADRPVERVELGSAKAIHGEVLRWRQTFGRATTDHDAGSELRRMLWQPLAPLLAGIDTVLISPDGPLAQLPWGALPGDKPGSYLIEQTALTVIPVPQMLPALLAQPRSTGLPATLLLAGDIDYGAEVSGAEFLADSRAAGRLRGGKLGSFADLAAAEGELTAVRNWYEQAQSPAAVDVLRREEGTEAAFRKQATSHTWLHVITHGFFAPADADRVAGAASPADEAKSGGIGAGVRMVDGRCLVEELVAEGPAQKDGRLKVNDEILAVATSDGDWQSTRRRELSKNVEQLRGPIGTKVQIKVRSHVSNEEATIELTRAAVARYSPPAPPVHAGLLSGLAFAGANLPPRDGHDDGILTAMEVAALDLSKVDTVVLSACETGLGEVAGGEGLLGLQRSFQVAGAKSVVASLWKVPDAATGRLMQRFYENLWKRKLGRLDALREAQIWMLREAQTTALGEAGNRGLDIETQPALQAGALPPYYWAAFVLSGDWR